MIQTSTSTEPPSCRSTSTAKEAPIRAAERADELRGEGDSEGALVWLGIVRAIEDLQREREPGEGVN